MLLWVRWLAPAALLTALLLSIDVCLREEHTVMFGRSVSRDGPDATSRHHSVKLCY